MRALTMGWIKRNWRVLGAAAVFITVLVVLKLFGVKTDADTISAIAGAVAAIAAWMAARDSATAARDSQTALGHATKPRIRVHAFSLDGRAIARIWNDSPFPAKDLSYECTREDDTIHRRSRGVLPPAPGPGPPNDAGLRWDVPIGHPWPEDNMHSRPLIRHVVRYSGLRGIMRWEYTDAVVAGSEPGWTQSITTDLLSS